MPRVLVLTAITGTQLGKRLTLEARVSTVGSAPGNDLVLTDRGVALRHAEIRQMLDRWFIVPLSAGAAGISLNGRPVASQSRLNQGDSLTLGPVTYQVSFAEVQEHAVGIPVATNSGVPRLGEYFLRRGIITNEQVERIARRQEELLRSGSRVPYGQVAYELGYINRSQLEAALADQRNDFNERFSD